MKHWKQHSYIFSSRRNQEPFPGGLLGDSCCHSCLPAPYRKIQSSHVSKSKPFIVLGDSWYCLQKAVVEDVMNGYEAEAKRPSQQHNVCFLLLPLQRRDSDGDNARRALCQIHTCVETRSGLLLRNLSQTRKQQCCSCTHILTSWLMSPPPALEHFKTKTLSGFTPPQKHRSWRLFRKQDLSFSFHLKRTWCHHTCTPPLQTLE